LLKTCTHNNQPAIIRQTLLSTTRRRSKTLQNHTQQPSPKRPTLSLINLAEPTPRSRHHCTPNPEPNPAARTTRPTKPLHQSPRRRSLRILPPHPTHPAHKTQNQKSNSSHRSRKLRNPHRRTKSERHRAHAIQSCQKISAEQSSPRPRQSAEQAVTLAAEEPRVFQVD
jgi:hypothetical protein